MDVSLAPRVRLECNPEIPVAPGEERWLLDTSLDEVYWYIISGTQSKITSPQFLLGYFSS